MEENEAEQDRRIAAVDGRIETEWGVNQPVADCHFARCDEGRETREQPDNLQQSGHDLDDSGAAEEAEQWLHARLSACRKTDHIDQAMAEKKGPCRNA